MDILAKRLKERARQLGISDREAARQCGLEERRYAHYAGGRREPDLETLVRIAQRLGTTPNWLLGLDPSGKKPSKAVLAIERLSMAAQELSDEELRIVTIQVEALAQR
jgi:transcriptional regulator with XRE-family HTH domain